MCSVCVLPHEFSLTHLRGFASASPRPDSQLPCFASASSMLLGLLKLPHPHHCSFHYQKATYFNSSTALHVLHSIGLAKFQVSSFSSFKVSKLQLCYGVLILFVFTFAGLGFILYWSEDVMQSGRSSQVIVGLFVLFASFNMFTMTN